MTYVGGTLYLNIFIAIGAFVFANLVVAVVVTNLVSKIRALESSRWCDLDKNFSISLFKLPLYLSFISPRALPLKS